MSDILPNRMGRTGQLDILIEYSKPVPYLQAWAIQQQFHAERLEDRRPDTLMLLEHEPVFTMGRRTASTHLHGGEEALRKKGVAVESVNRGGSITYHGPGQVVGYPILKLSDFASGPREYVRLLEETLLRTLAVWGIDAHRERTTPGVFVRVGHEEAKIASIGVRVDRGVTLHGFALNVDLDLEPFSSIVPCGLAGYGMTSVAAVRRSSLSLALVAQQLADQFGSVFNLTWKRSQGSDIEQSHCCLSY